MRRRALLAVVGALAAGCATVPPVPDSGTAELDREPLPEHWTLDGRLALSDAARSWQASLHWEQRGAHYRIDLVGPLGQGRLAIRGGPDGVSLETERETLHAEDPDELLARATGLRLPVRGLRYWVLGRPAPAAPARPVTDDQGRLRRLQQSGWYLTYPNYITVEGRPMPQRIRAEREALDLRVLITRWRLT
ncbi:MAG: lipoprotein insertase outer membrane protein LolB [Candidatus Competibacterales bacterium]|nr:lipoprotein insertase outer membrane protein LolB [Candidatus Competibacterales bacterium]